MANEENLKILKQGVEAWNRWRLNISNFCNWKDHDAYQQAFERLLRDLKAAG